MKITWVPVALICALTMAGCKASQPGKLETSVMSDIKRNVTIGGKDVKNPIPYTPEAATEGAEHFQHHCQICHGLDGQNTGVPFADKMSPPVPRLNSRAVQAYTDGQLHWIIKNGIAPSGMPAARDIFHDEEIWQLVLYIRHLPPQGSLGEPKLYDGQRHAGVRCQQWAGEQQSSPAHRSLLLGFN